MFSFAVMSGIEWGTADEKQKESEALKQLFIEALAAVRMIFFSPLNCLTWKIFRSQREKKKKLSSISPHLFSICFPSLLLWPSYLHHINLKWLQRSLKRNESSPEQP